MHTPMPMMEIARLEERHIAGKLAAMAQETRPFAGGIMARGAPGAWFNRAHGAGLDGPVDPEEVDRLIDFYEQRGIEPRLELCPFAHQTLVDALAARGFAVRRFLIVLAREVDAAERIEPPHPAPRGVVIERIRPGDGEAIEAFGRLFVEGFEVRGEDRIAETMRAARHVVEAEGSIGVRAMLDGACVGVAAMELAGPLASLFGACVTASARGRGIQQALLAWRLREAAASGARVATIQSRPGIPTERNAMRMGFTVAYNNVVLVRPGEGLVGVPGG